MRKIILAGALAALAAVPSVAVLQAQPAKQAVAPGPAPHTVRGELKLFQDVNYNGDDWVLDSASPTVHTDWNIRSIAIHPGDSWQLCARSRYREPCIILNRSVHDASLIGIEGQIGSARPAPVGGAAPAH
jgi:hypothetical protein